MYCGGLGKSCVRAICCSHGSASQVTTCARCVLLAFMAIYMLSCCSRVLQVTKHTHTSVSYNACSVESAECPYWNGESALNMHARLAARALSKMLVYPRAS